MALLLFFITLSCRRSNFDDERLIMSLIVRALCPDPLSPLRLLCRMWQHVTLQIAERQRSSRKQDQLSCPCPLRRCICNGRWLFPCVCLFSILKYRFCWAFLV